MIDDLFHGQRRRFRNVPNGLESSGDREIIGRADDFAHGVMFHQRSLIPPTRGNRQYHAGQTGLLSRPEVKTAEEELNENIVGNIGNNQVFFDMSKKIQK